jgi:hypothetical protein
VTERGHLKTAFNAAKTFTKSVEAVAASRAVQNGHDLNRLEEEVVKVKAYADTFKPDKVRAGGGCLASLPGAGMHLSVPLQEEFAGDKKKWNSVSNCFFAFKSKVSGSCGGPTVCGFCHDPVCLFVQLVKTFSFAYKQECVFHEEEVKIEALVSEHGVSRKRALEMLKEEAQKDRARLAREKDLAEQARREAEAAARAAMAGMHDNAIVSNEGGAIVTAEGDDEADAVLAHAEAEEADKALTTAFVRRTRQTQREAAKRYVEEAEEDEEEEEAAAGAGAARRVRRATAAPGAQAPTMRRAVPMLRRQPTQSQMTEQEDGTFVYTPSRATVEMTNATRDYLKTNFVQGGVLAVDELEQWVATKAASPQGISELRRILTALALGSTVGAVLVAEVPEAVAGEEEDDDEVAVAGAEEVDE